MKSTFKKAMMPLAVVVLGAAAAFATNAAKQNDKPSAIMDAYHYDISKPIESRCVKVQVEDCVNLGNVICTDSSLNQVWSDGTENNQDLTCTHQLFKL